MPRESKGPDINQCLAGYRLVRKGNRANRKSWDVHTGRRDAKVDVAVLPLLLMLMPANQFIYIYLQHSNVSLETDCARGCRLSARTTRESESIPLAAGYEIRGVQIAPSSRLIQIVGRCWRRGESKVHSTFQSIHSFMIQNGRNRGWKQKILLHKRLLEIRVSREVECYLRLENITDNKKIFNEWNRHYERERRFYWLRRTKNSYQNLKRRQLKDEELNDSSTKKEAIVQWKNKSHKM